MAGTDGDKGNEGGGWPAVVQQVLNILGGAARPAIIVAGMVVVIYLVIEQGNKIVSESEKARQEAAKINEQALKDANESLANAQKQLLETYTKFQEIGSRQIGNLKEVLDLREVVEQERQGKIEDIKRLENEKKETERDLERNKREGERIIEELKNKEKQLVTQGEDLKTRQTQLEKARSDFEQEKREREKAERSRLKNAETYNSVKDKLIDLAKAVNESEGSIRDETKQLARKILSAVVDLKDLLREFVENPTNETFTALRPVIGLSRDDLINVNCEALGFSLCLDISNLVSSSGVFFMVVSQSDYAYNNVLIISLEKNLVVDTEYARIIFAIGMHAADDWNKEVVATRVIAQDRSEFDFMKLSGTSWTIQDAIRSDENDARFNVIFDRVQSPLSILSPEKYRSLFRDDYKESIKESDPRGEPAVNFAMARRSVNFHAADIRSAVQIPADIQQRFNQLADAAVARADISTLGDALDPGLDPGILGRFAAVILKREFQIVRYQAATGDTNASAVVAEYHPLETGPETRRATFRFRRANTESPWRLAAMDIEGQLKSAD